MTYNNSIEGGIILKNVCIIGAGQLGSRHLQALKNVNQPLNIKVFDPNMKSLEVARERYEAVSAGEYDQCIEYTSDFDDLFPETDIAIIATSSNVRRQVVENLLNRSVVKYMIMEKLLFQKKVDFYHVNRMLEKSGGKVWVNCCMRMMPVYEGIKNAHKKEEVFYHISGSSYGLVTNLIHFIDYLAHLIDCLDYSVDTSGLGKTPIPSKREGFLELTGSVTVNFKDGSQGVFTCYPDGNTPLCAQIFSKQTRYIIRETEGKMWSAKAEENWVWKESDIRIPYQSEMTKYLLESILSKGECLLPSYHDSMKIHIPLIDSLLDFLNENSDKKFELIPFT